MISLLLPFRDARATLSTALRSVLRESEIAEIVAIDDGSTDGSGDLARGAGDPRVVVVNAGGVGVAGALTLGLEHARGDVIARMDADDVSLPGRFGAQLRLLESDARLAAVGTRVVVDRSAGPGLHDYVRWQNSLESPDEHARDLLVESPLCHPSTIIRRSALDAVGGWRDAPWPEDWDLWLRLDAAGWRLGKVPVVGLVWTHRPERATFRDERCSAERLVEARAHFLAARLGDGRAFAIWGAGKTGRRLARALERHDLRPTRFVDVDPRKIGRRARGVPIVAPAELAPGDEHLVVAVGDKGARSIVRARLERAGFVERRDFVCAA